MTWLVAFWIGATMSWFAGFYLGYYCGRRRG